MNWKRVVFFVLLLILATAAAAFPFGLMARFIARQGEPLPPWLFYGQAVAVPLASVLVFALLAMRQRERTFAHAWAVGIGAWIVSFPINVLWLNQRLSGSIAGLVIIGIVVPVGTFIGIKVRALSARADRSQKG